MSTITVTTSEGTVSTVTINQGQQGPAGVSLSVSNAGVNRLISSDGTLSGVVAQSGLTFDGSLLAISGVAVSVSGHVHTSSDISDFNEAVDDRLGGASGLFAAGTGINLSYNDGSNQFTISTTGVSFSGHTHSSSDITDFNSAVSGLLPTISNSGDNRILTSTGTTLGINAESNLTFDGSSLQVNGTGVSVSGHTHTAANITDFNSSVSGLLPSVTGTGYVNSSFGGNVYTISVSGLQPTGNYSTVGHSHTSSDVTDFTEAVQDVVGASGFLVGQSGITISYSDTSGTLTITGGGGGGATISNAGDNRILTSDGTSTGINGESNLIFDNSNNTLSVGQTGLSANPGQLNVYASSGISVAAISIRDTTDADRLAFSYVAGDSTSITSPNDPMYITSTSSSIDIFASSQILITADTNAISLVGTQLLFNGTGVSISGHTHTASNITDFNTTVSGLLPTIANSGDNRILTSTGSSTGVNAESNATFDGTNFNISGVFNIDNIRIDNNIISTNVNNTSLALSPSGVGDVFILADTLSVGDPNLPATITTNGTGTLVINTNSGTNAGSITLNQGVNGNINIVPNGTGNVGIGTSSPIYRLDVTGGGRFNQVYPTVVSGVIVSSALDTNVASGQIFDIVLTENITLNNPTNSVDGVTIRWRFKQDGTGSRTVTLDSDFVIPSSASSPLPFSTGANVVDTLAATYYGIDSKWHIVAFVPGY